ncbi:MAG: T9SS type A sorting domain-containing protein [Flavobacteriales bacterium]|nr:T9SS type A sorting domain-containing protein [Flavobacteriales bacterium]
MKIKLIAVLCCISIWSFSQSVGDTIVVQTFDYSMTYGSGPWSGGNRDTIAYFPNDPNLTFEKIILSYNMRCKDNVVNTNGQANNIGCGAWDYSCNTYIHDSTRVDSLLLKTPSHSISNYSGLGYDYSFNPVYNFIQFIQQTANVNSIASENTTSVGTGTDSLDFVLETNQNSHKSQFLYHADELAVLGLINDTINALSLNILSGTQGVNFLSIKLKLTTDTVLSANSPHISGFTEVYNSNTVLQNGINKFQFTNPFVWDSVSNVIVEFSFTNSTSGTTTLIQGEWTSDIMGLNSSDAHHITVHSAESIDLPTTALGSISDEITVSFWINGNENVLPQNTTIFEAYDASGSRTVNIHFPWSNGRMYWDCGNSGTSSYDRIDKAANLNEYTADWSHWAFTKNATTGEMNIFRNGVLWHSGTGMNRTMDIATLKLASQGNANGYFWDGKIKEVRVFNIELSISTILDWMNKRIDNSHPDYANLLAHYPLDEGVGTTSLDNTANQQIATFSGNVNWNSDRGDNINQFFTETNSRPNIDFYQGIYNLTISTDTILDSVMAAANTVNEYAIDPNWGTLLNDDIITLSTNTYWEAVSYTYDAFGNQISSVATTIDGTINITDLPYYKRYPMAFQIMSFVTPYGAYLDLGVDGKTWYFDVTDYAPVFNGNKRITMDAGGQWQEDMDIKFLFIVGTPPRDVLEMQNIWKVQSKNYTQIQNNDAYEPRTHNLLLNADAFKVRTVITGHGQEGEFIPQTHTLNIDGGTVDYSWQVWTECADNPIFPQGGTWIYDRAGWCPGQPTDLREDDISFLVTPGQSHIFDYNVLGGSGTTKYWTSSQLVSYGSPNFTLDAAIVDVLSPTNKVNYIRKNPMCSKPEVVIQNTGSDVLTSLTIEYWINNSPDKETFTWTGNLNFLEKETVSLPDPSSLWIDTNSSNNVFYTEISNPNGLADGYSFNNNISSTFELPEIMPSVFALWFGTNNGMVNAFTQESETTWKFLDNNDNVVYSSGTLYANNQYRDTLSFDGRCYTFVINDADDDGLEFWNNNDGAGMVRFREIGASWIKDDFELDFGKYLQYEFMVEQAISSVDNQDYNLTIYPNPATNHLIINGDLSNFSELVITDNLGKVVLSEVINKNSNSQKINIKSLAKGIYFIKIDDGKIIRKIVKQ